MVSEQIELQHKVCVIFPYRIQTQGLYFPQQYQSNACETTKRTFCPGHLFLKTHLLKEESQSR